MKDIAIIMPCWKSPELLKISIPSLQQSITTDSEIIVVLNEADSDSINYLDVLGIYHIDKEKNFGPSAVDFAIDYVKEQRFKYVSNVNSDMLFQKGWDNITIDILEKNKPCSVSHTLVEPIKSAQSLYDNLGNFLEQDINDRFTDNVESGKYICDNEIWYNHPITCSTTDFLAVNGYSNNMEQEWIQLAGRGLDDSFAYRLYQLHHGKFKFIKSNKIFCYHGVSLNSKKLKSRQRGHHAFQKKTGMTLQNFRKIINVGSKVVELEK